MLPVFCQIKANSNSTMKLTVKNSLATALAIAGTAAFSSTAGAAVVYDETFETYALGDSSGQGLWVDFGGAQLSNVVNTIANGGTQSLALSTSPGYGSDTTIDLAAPITSGQLQLSFDIYQPTGFDGSAHIFLSRGATLGGVFDEGFHLFGDGTAGTFFDTGSPTTPLLLDQWVPVIVNIDLDADTANASYGGTEIFNGVWNNGGTAPTQFQGVNIWAAEGQAVSTYNIDNFKLETVPEPSGVALLGLGFAGLVLRRRRA
ncbi:MAG: hypothetical protein ACI9NC_003316 [Verrucomicrobiales bacterium]|jgi:hypothetical protein